MLTAPDTVEPLAGEVIFTTEPLGVGVGVGVAVAVGVGVAEPLATVMVTESWLITPVLLLAVTEIVCVPFGTVVESQLKVKGGLDAK